MPNIDDVALPLSLEKFILGICTLQKLTSRTKTPFRKFPGIDPFRKSKISFVEVGWGGGGGYKMEWPTHDAAIEHRPQGYKISEPNKSVKITVSMK